MAVILIPVGKTPTEPQFGLDTFTEHYKCGSPADIVLTDPTVPQKGDPHPSYPFMFVGDRNIQETSESASALDLVYIGVLKDDGAGNPILPPNRHKYGNSIQTATSNLSVGGQTPASPVTVQFYAQTSELVFHSYLTVGELNTAPNPPRDPELISIVSLDVAFGPGTMVSDQILNNFFSIHTTDVMTSIEIVKDGKFWQNTEVKTVYYGSPFAVSQLFGGNKAIALWRAGQDYVVNDVLGISNFLLAPGTASVKITAVDARGAITGFTILSDTINTTNTLVMAGTGGSGTGAEFRVVNYPVV